MRSMVEGPSSAFATVPSARQMKTCGLLAIFGAGLRYRRSFFGSSCGNGRAGSDIVASFRARDM